MPCLTSNESTRTGLRLTKNSDMNRDGGKRTTIRQSRKTEIRKNSPNMQENGPFAFNHFACVTIPLCPAANGRTRQGSGAAESGASRITPVWTHVLGAMVIRSIVICLFDDLSAKRLLLETTHGKNGSSNKGRPPDREETLHKGA
jgi:hypothetical protein